MELLISVLLLSLLSVGLLMALRIGLNTYSKAQGKMMDNRRVVGAQRILEQQLEGLVPVVAPCAGAAGATGIFFQGTEETMRLVSTFSLQGAWRGPAQVREIFVISGADGRGVRLVVNETPFAGPASAAGACRGGYLSASAGPKSFVLADKLASCHFSYLEQPPDQGRPAEWSPRFRGMAWPLAVRVEMAPLEPDPSRLQPITVVAPIRVFRRPEIAYVDVVQ